VTLCAFIAPHNNYLKKEILLKEDNESQEEKNKLA